MRPCPQCGSRIMTVGHTVTIWQTIRLEVTDEQGNWKELDNDLHDQIDADPFEQAVCDACGHEFDPEEDT
jgi:hypothetical protein